MLTGKSHFYFCAKLKRTTENIHDCFSCWNYFFSQSRTQGFIFCANLACSPIYFTLLLASFKKGECCVGSSVLHRAKWKCGRLLRFVSTTDVSSGTHSTLNSSSEKQRHHFVARNRGSLVHHFASSFLIASSFYILMYTIVLKYKYKCIYNKAVYTSCYNAKLLSSVKNVSSCLHVLHVSFCFVLK